MAAPDALSRSVPVIESLETTDANAIKDRWYNKLLENVSSNPDKYSCFRLQDQVLYKFLSDNNSDLTPENDKWKIVVPKERRKELLRQCHDIPISGHLGVFKTYHRLADRYFWPKMKADVATYIRKCHTCLRTKPEQKAKQGQMGGHSRVTKPWEVISTDLIGPLPRSRKGYSYILVVCDLYSKFSLCFPLRKANALRIVEHIENEVFLMFGVSKTIVSDNGVQFRRKEYRQLLAKYEVKPSYTSYYHPQANPTERVNRVLKTMLIAYVSDNHRDWDKYLPQVACALRSATHETTGASPYLVNFGKEMLLSGSDHRHTVDFSLDQKDVGKRSLSIAKLYQDIQTRLQKAYEKSKSRYDLRHRPVSYYPNQVVWRKNYVLSDASKYYTAKLADKFVGPFLIHKRLSPTTYELKDYDDNVMPETWNVAQLKPQPIDDDST